MRKKTTQISTITGVSIVVANMIGTGAFTSLGFQLNDLSNTSTILTLWILGGIFALSGAFSYAEVGTNIRLSGGEYAFLDKLYHPVIGYLSGWVSITVGFAAPIALSAIAFTEYFRNYSGRQLGYWVSCP
ncbi:MAG: amino acid permease [Bacteroidales bacterium]|nr:amino acid permease [Bacteroidales bacterium]